MRHIEVILGSMLALALVACGTAQSTQVPTAMPLPSATALPAPKTLTPPTPLPSAIAVGSPTSPTATQAPPMVGTKVAVTGGAYSNVTPAQLKTMLANKHFLFINVHIPYEGEIEQTDAKIPFDQVELRINEFPPDKNAMVFLYCRSGNMSATAAQTLIRLGYTNIWNLEGGMIAWENAGLPLFKR